MATPHNTAEKGQIAKTVLMPGDPLRAKFIAETYLENPVCFNTVRGMYGFTGTYQGKEISVMGHGMGMASIGIYTYELFGFYDVERIIRIGSAGGLQPSLKLGDIVLAEGACTMSSYAEQFGVRGHFAPVASFPLLRRAAETAEALGIPYQAGNVVSSDTFYSPVGAEENAMWKSVGALCVEMECAALYLNAAHFGKQALGILTISDIIGSTEAMTAEERQTQFRSMMKLALETALKL